MTDDGKPDWDDAFAAELRGAVVLVGITYDEPGGARLDQFFGFVEHADPRKGIQLRLSGSRQGEFYWLPPDLRAMIPADPGTYRLRGTGEEVVDPDYVTTWTMTPPGS